MTTDSDDEIGIAELIMLWWRKKWLILGAAFLFAAVAAVITLMIPNHYRTRAVLAPAADATSQVPRSLAAQFSSLSGISLGGVGADATQVAMATLKSRSFLVSFVRRHGLEVPLIAAKGWDFESGTWILDRAIYDRETGKWLREPTVLRSAEPTDGELFEKFADSLEVDHDRATNLVTLRLTSLSPVAARDWASFLIRDLNAEMRAKAKSEAAASIAFLQQEVSQTSIATIRDVLNGLIEEQYKARVLAEVRPNFAFSVIDEPILPEIKIFPNRTLICIAATFFGAAFSAFVILLLRVFRT